MNFFYRIQRFMMGRYGIDNLFYILAGAAAILALVNVYVRSVVLQLLVYALIVYAFYRAMSRNYESRRRENRWITDLMNKFSNYRNTVRQRRADVMHIYKKCPGCKAVLKLPRRPGKHTTVCPKCNKKFNVYVKK